MSLNIIKNNDDDDFLFMDLSKQNKKLLRLPRKWIVLMTIRIILNIISQKSYIHPDEFFQGPEVVAGELFNCSEKIYRAWEFNFDGKQEPIRSISIPYLVYGTPLYILKILSSLNVIRDYSNLKFNEFDSPNLPAGLVKVQTSTLIYYPRLFMTILSLIVDFSLLLIAEMCDLDEVSILITFSSSYIAFVYLTRTFSNTIETYLFALLILLVLKSIKSQYVLNEKIVYSSKDKDNKKQNTSLRSNKHPSTKKILLFDIHKYNHLSGLIGLVLCIGVFNRPTFLIYSFIPVLYWVLHGLDKCNRFSQVLSFALHRLISLCKLALPVAFIFILIDTAYYYKLKTLDEVIELVGKQKKLLITPYNFFKYNIDSNNLKQHGQHPFYQHLLVNSFLLFGFNHIVLFFIFIQFMIQFVLFVTRIKLSDNNEANNRPNSFIRYLRIYTKNIYNLLINNTLCFFLFSFVVPMFVFSFVKHQEPRFLLPLIVPICLTTSHCVFGNQSHAFVRYFWIAFNFLGLIVYGYFHQGGMIASLSHVQKQFTHTANLQIDQHVIFYQTYMPPRYLAMAPLASNIISNKRYAYELKKIFEDDSVIDFDNHKKKKNEDAIEVPQRYIYDVNANLNKVVDSIKKNYENKTNKNYAIFLTTPEVVGLGLELKSNKNSKYDIQPMVQFKFHFSFEHLEHYVNYLKCKLKSLDESKKCKNWSTLSRLSQCFSLSFYQIS